MSQLLHANVMLIDNFGGPYDTCSWLSVQQISLAQHICKAGTLTGGTLCGVDKDISFGDQLHVTVHMQAFGVVRLCIPRQGQTCQPWLSTLCEANQPILMSSQKPTQLPDPCSLLLELQR